MGIAVVRSCIETPTDDITHYRESKISWGQAREIDGKIAMI